MIASARRRTGHLAHRVPIGRALKIARLQRGLTADEVAAACNVSRSRVYQWEAGTYVFPKNFPLIAATLNIPVKKLRDFNGRPQ